MELTKGKIISVSKARPMPTHQRLRANDREDLQDRWKRAVHLDKEPAIVVREPGPAAHPTAQNNHLMSQCRVLRLPVSCRSNQENG